LNPILVLLLLEVINSAKEYKKLVLMEQKH